MTALARAKTPVLQDDVPELRTRETPWNVVAGE
jgi:hypothetical protein